MTDRRRFAPEVVQNTTPKLAEITDLVLFGDVWARPELSPRDRSLITVAALVVSERDRQLPGHLRRALDNGVTADELREVITHLAFYAGWPPAVTATEILAAVLDDSAGSAG